MSGNSTLSRFRVTKESRTCGAFVRLLDFDFAFDFDFALLSKISPSGFGKPRVLLYAFISAFLSLEWAAPLRTSDESSGVGWGSREDGDSAVSRSFELPRVEAYRLKVKRSISPMTSLRPEISFLKREKIYTAIWWFFCRLAVT